MLFLKVVENINLYADLILPVPLQQVFTYHVPTPLESRVKVGCRVIVQFGNRKLYSALIKTIHNNAPVYETKPIETVLDDEPIINPLIFKFWEWLSGYYMCSEGEIMKAALPAGLKLESHSSVALSNSEINIEESLSPTEENVLNYLNSHQSATIQQICSLTKRNNALPVIKTLLNKGYIHVEERITGSYKPKKAAYIKIAEHLISETDFEEAFKTLKRAQKQLDLFMLILNKLNHFSPSKKELISRKEIVGDTGFSDTNLKTLEKRGLIEIIEIEVTRLPNAERETFINKLNTHQERALNEVYSHFRKTDVVLLHGVTASGKTEIYIKMIEEQLKRGKQVLYLLPEIALTSQIIKRLTNVFGNLAGVYHSKFNDSERVEIWNTVQNYNQTDEPKFQLILGARSSLLLPFKNLGLIIVDEEHETSFKQFDPAPRYNARDAAVVLAKLHQAKVLMGTATPSFESFYNTKTGKYGYVHLQYRHHEIQLPEIFLSDIKDAYKRKTMKSHFTPMLFAEMENALDNGEQIILFQNRRGFSPFVQCRDCGSIPACKHCDVSLTYHKFNNNLQCHYCGYTVALTGKCAHCGSPDVQNKGFGTEKIEDELNIFFPDIKIGRLDLDASRGKTGFEKVINNFASGKTRILVGTQMITKGLDFDNVSLVGILNADNLLNYPDFRSYERAYQLMVQVSGRAGRKNKRGKVIIQTSQPGHKVFDYLLNNNYEDFFNLYINERNIFKYPPWFRLIYLTIKHKNRDRAIAASKQLAAEIRSTFKSNMLGPDFHLISRLQQYYQLVIRLKLDKNASPSAYKETLHSAITKTKGLPGNASVIFNIDVDPL